ncbi:MAG: ArsR family transcriptional regulator, partial [Thermodesulfobacteriota bacterium]
EIKRILRPGGVFVLSDFDLHQKEEVRKKYGGVWLGFAKEQLQEWLQEAGFAILQLEEYQVRQGLKVNVLVSRRS